MRRFFLITTNGLFDEWSSSASLALRKFKGSPAGVLGIFDAECVAQPPPGHRGAYVAFIGQPFNDKGAQA